MSDRPTPSEGTDRDAESADLEREAQRVAARVIARAQLASGVAKIFAKVGRDALDESTAKARIYLRAVAKEALRAQLGPEAEALAEKGLDDVMRFAKAAALAAADVAAAEVTRAADPKKPGAPPTE